MRIKTKKSRTVLEKVEAVLTLHRVQNPEVPLSISSLARQAEVSRANLYISHPELIKKLQTTRRKKDSIDVNLQRLQLKKVCDENTELKRVNKALLYLNVELRREIANLQKRLKK